MRGVDYLVDDKGKRKAVMINLEDWGKLWEDFQDVMISEARKNELTVSLDAFNDELEQDNGKPA